MNTQDIDKIWVEFDLTDHVRSVTHYAGQISVLDYEALYEGTYKKPFLKLLHAFWYNWPEDDDDWQGKKLVEYGKGDYSEYQGEILIKVDCVLTVERLNHGPVEMQGRHL